MNDLEKRMREMMMPIDQCIQLTDDQDDMLMLACAMLQRTREILDAELGESGRKQMFRDLV